MGPLLSYASTVISYRSKYKERGERNAEEGGVSCI